jgi:hypothetical protein
MKEVFDEVINIISMINIYLENYSFDNNYDIT